MFLEFVKNNYRLFIDVVAIVFGIILLIVRKRSIKDILTYIYNYSISAILSAEETELKGENKLAFAMKLVKDSLKAKFPEIDVNKYSKVIQFTIEELLLTPQKKEKKED